MSGGVPVSRRLGSVTVSLILAAGLLASPHKTVGATGCDANDLACGVQPLPETALNNAACGPAAAALLLEAYGPIPGATVHDKLAAVAQYVHQNGGSKDANGHWVPGTGFTSTTAMLGITNAGPAFNVPVTGATWRKTTASGWVSTLREETGTAGRPVIVLLTDGSVLWPTWDKKPMGHFVVVSGISSDGLVITYDAWDGSLHKWDQSTFQKAWSAPNPPAGTGFDYLEVDVSEATLVRKGSGPQPSVAPGGTWIAPADGSAVRDPIHVAAHAYPSKAGDPAIDHVAFTVWWPALGDKTGPWKTACNVTAPTSGDEYECDFSAADLGAPPGQLWLSFDVYDKAGNRSLAPNGERSVNWSGPVDVVVGGDWQTYQGDGYVVDYPGAAQTYSTASNGIYAVSASYYEEGPSTDPDVIYLVEKVSFPSGLLSLTGQDLTPYLKAALSSYAGYSSGTLSTARDVTIDGRSGVEITSSGANGAFADGQILVAGDSIYMIVAGYYQNRGQADTSTFFASFHLR